MPATSRRATRLHTSASGTAARRQVRDACGSDSCFRPNAHVLHDPPSPSPWARAHDVEIAARVAPDAVARLERRVAPLREALAFQREDADVAAVVLDDIDDVVGIDVDDRGTDELRRPDVEQSSFL